ncbi:integrase catalytic domain-containing protein [Nephila pilipes]|uniref:Integrase catalytic domain-containing protein n=1 Tax=Nephila pilipes TaxID=299642 RepID=A0A8X6QMK1_NEPPI|nr:integrase catalytic domain-containing protein [Nephila pilipes]
MELNDLYIECNRSLQGLNALGKNTEANGRILVPKNIRAFPQEIHCRWITYAKSEKLAEGNITRLMQFLAEEVVGSVEAQKTDSKITLSWIRSDPNKWKTFVCNRTTEILQYTSPVQRRHCPGTQNPAYHLCGVEELQKSKDYWILKVQQCFHAENGSSQKQTSFKYNIKDGTLQSLPKEQSNKTL